MIMKQLILGGCAAIILSIATAQAGPCNTGGKSAQDAGAARRRVTPVRPSARPVRQMLNTRQPAL
jgi:hypothetical protein